MLNFLSDRTHFVYTGYCLLNSQNNKFFTGVQGTAVTFQKLSPQMINFYIDHYQPFDKAGSYGIQDYSAIFVKCITGCFYNVVGFPLAKFYHQTREKLGSLL
jgi:septum formation protein